MTSDLSPGRRTAGDEPSRRTNRPYAARAAEAIAEVARAAEISRRAAADAERALAALRRQQEYLAAAQQRLTERLSAHVARVGVTRRPEDVGLGRSGRARQHPHPPE